jgi:hypothetical protein
MDKIHNNFNNPIDPFQNSEELVSPVVAAELTRLMTEIVDARIHKRLSQQDIIKVYDAEIVDYSTTDKSKTYSVKEGGGTTAISHIVSIEVVSSITVKYDKDFSVGISNSSVQQIPVDYLSGTRKKWVKICTYDGVQFYVLHTL